MKKILTMLTMLTAVFTLSAQSIPDEIAHYPMREGSGKEIRESKNRLAPGKIYKSFWTVRDTLSLVDFGGMKIEGRTLQILNSSGYDMALSAYSIGASLTSFVFRASRAGASFQWLLNLGRAVFTTPEEWDGGDYSFDSDGLHIACDNGQESFSFYALRIYNAFLTDAQIMEHARLDAERFNLTEGI